MEERKEHDEMSDGTKTKDVSAYEDSWYRSLKALADMRPTEDDEQTSDTPED